MRRLGPVLVASCLVAAVPAATEDRPGQALPPPTLAPAAPQPSAVEGVAGAYTFRTHCASCHGADGKGEGPMAANLRFRPPDLTLVAKRNGGSFPAERVQRIVDGRNPLKGHGGSDMPIWGDAFKNADTGYDEAHVKARVQSVVDYLKTIQVR
jgi:mono/diheme cytochrome c family protein